MRNSYLESLTCSATGEALERGSLLNLSPAGKPILCNYDLPAIARDVDRDRVSSRGRGMWRWRELMPLPLEHEPVALGEGDTPLLAAPRLGKELGLERLWIKDESGNLLQIEADDPEGSCDGIFGYACYVLHVDDIQFIRL